METRDTMTKTKMDLSVTLHCLCPETIFAPVERHTLSPSMSVSRYPTRRDTTPSVGLSGVSLDAPDTGYR